METTRRAALLSALSYTRILGANDRIGLGVIGTGNRGTSVMRHFARNADVEVRALCDVYAARIDAAKSHAPAAAGFADHRHLLDQKNLDAVLIASPDHWHKDHAIDAMTAGKDVYLEKPLCRTRDEAPQIVKAARVQDRICQIGVQQRSGRIYREALERFVQSGLTGKITHVNCCWHTGVPEKLPSEPARVPSNLDWVRFLGPVKYRPWSAGQYLNFRAFLDFNGGKMTDFGHHWLDAVNMFLGERCPHSAVFAGGIFHPRGDGRTAPDTCSALFEYDGYTVSFESHAVAHPPEYGITFYGAEGRLFVNRNRYEFRAADPKAPPVEQKIPGDITSEHVRNFLDCTRSRQLPRGDVGLAAISVQAPLLAVESYVQKRRIRFDPERQEALPL